MYFWDSRRLAVDLRNDAVPASTLRNYFIALLILGAPSVFYGLYAGGTPDVWDAVRILGSIAIIIVGILRAYQTNGGDEGSRFIEKSVALLLPLGIQSFVLFGALFVAWVPVEQALSARLSADGNALASDLSSVLFEHALYAWLMWRLVVHIADTVVDSAEQVGAPEAEAPPADAH